MQSSVLLDKKSCDILTLYFIRNAGNFEVKRTEKRPVTRPIVTGERYLRGTSPDIQWHPTFFFYQKSIGQQREIFSLKGVRPRFRIFELINFYFFSSDQEILGMFSSPFSTHFFQFLRCFTLKCICWWNVS